MKKKQTDSSNRLGVVIQARMGSTRLPGKVLLPFYQDQSILSIIIDKFKNFDFPIILATSKSPQDDVLVELARRSGVAAYQGDEENVLSRFTEIAARFDLDYIVRVCADNPFISISLFEELLAAADGLNWEFDYLSHRVQNKPVMLTHFGFFVEIVKASALARVAGFTNEKTYFEHVTNFVYTHPKLFVVKWLDVAVDFFVSDQLRLTIDTPGDFQLLADLYTKLIARYGGVEIEHINDFVAQDAGLLAKMSEHILANTK